MTQRIKALSLADSFMDLAYDLRQNAERELLKSWQPALHYLKYQKQIRDADALFEAGVFLKQER